MAQPLEPDVEPLGVSPKTTQKMTGLGKTTVAKFIKDGTLKSRKIGRSRRVLVASIRELMS
jgi:hypothetical protein